MVTGGNRGIGRAIAGGLGQAGEPADARALLRTAIRDDNPVVFFEHKLLYSRRGEVPEQMERLEFGRAAVRRNGRHATVLAAQAMLDKVLAVAGRLAAEGIELEVIDPRTLVPFDSEAVVESVRKTNRLLICHEATERGGWGAEVAMQVGELAFDHVDAPVARVWGANVPVPYSPSRRRWCPVRPPSRKASDRFWRAPVGARRGGSGRPTANRDPS
ncbi:MAG: hypothetical protein JF888_01055 [Candidatus Dormibacteraeota bacterium]|uniref:Transketolase C-terminal domain-containing protein n=1 Tax=Candidatus Dormiibacter inghamiae TaxID=3127013 RepID=A0A934KFT5_9BACT|nr:hypothetical protein [Candidatus Dormibacteraeota bacterium]MBJ7605291.1 hypothetical protein [Candidatus Dormibacteraeota bacterium]